ncbi:MAG: SDR family NAD(P)-dependent oxidoreductase [Pseudomonadota bacterium]
MNTTKPSCLIVGAGPGIGQALALAFAREGFAIALCARNAGKLLAIQEDVRETGGHAEVFSADAGDESALRTMLAQVTKALGAPQVLIYNASAGAIGKPLALMRERLLQEFQVNVASALMLAQEVAPAMKTAGRGTIIFTGGSFAYEPAANYSSLSLGKAALRNLTFSLAQELGASGIHVGTVTVYGFVQPGTHFDPSHIAEAFVTLHRQPKGHFQIEHVYR